MKDSTLIQNFIVHLDSIEISPQIINNLPAQASDSTNSWIAFGSILIAAFAAILTVYQVRLGVVSQARIRWIESTRSDIIELFDEADGVIAFFKRVFDMRSFPKGELDSMMETDYKPAMRRTRMVLRRITLMLNPNEEEHKSFINDLNKALDLHKHREKDKSEESIIREFISYYEANDEGLRQRLNRILRIEWKKAKGWRIR